VLARENAELRRFLAAARGGTEAPPDDGPDGPGAGSVLRPAGSAINIQDAMGLGKGSRNRKNYKSRCETDFKSDNYLPLN
jgi:hypothetical protein